jgi:hypothetical protein
MAIAGKSGRPVGLPKTGGRQKGTPNRATLTAAEKLEALGCDPLEGMARIAMDERNSPETRGRFYSELAQYIYPKRKAVEVIDEQATEINVNTDLDDSEDPCERKPGETPNDACAEIHVNTDLPNSEDPDDVGEPQS